MSEKRFLSELVGDSAQRTRGAGGGAEWPCDGHQGDGAEYGQTCSEQTCGEQTRGGQTCGGQTRGEQTRGGQTCGEQTSGEQTRGGQTRGEQTSGEQIRGEQTCDRSHCPGNTFLMSNIAASGNIKRHGNRVHILALGDVGATLLLGLKLLGGKSHSPERQSHAACHESGQTQEMQRAAADSSRLIDVIGIYDLDAKVSARYEMEMNQISWPFEGGEGSLPRVEVVTEDELFNCDMFVFCASKQVPPIGAAGDVRLMQLEANRPIVQYFARQAAAAGFGGIFAVVSDPVDQLCKAAISGTGLAAGQVRGFGLGVMNKRAEYFAAQNPKTEHYLTEGRAYGPHGGDLVIANSVKNYDHELSLELTKKAVEANLRVRDLGFKPYIAPALSSGAMPLILTLSGGWHYSSMFFGDVKKVSDGAFLGVRNRTVNFGTSSCSARISEDGSATDLMGGSAACDVTEELVLGWTSEIEDVPLPPELFQRIEAAYRGLCEYK